MDLALLLCFPSGCHCIPSSTCILESICSRTNRECRELLEHFRSIFKSGTLQDQLKVAPNLDLIEKSVIIRNELVLGVEDIHKNYQNVFGSFEFGVSFRNHLIAVPNSNRFV